MNSEYKEDYHTILTAAQQLVQFIEPIYDIKQKLEWCWQAETAEVAQHLNKVLDKLRSAISDLIWLAARMEEDTDDPDEIQG